ncbi:hypothetical protein HF086_005710 [Spodoptera exigua]|uniref:Peptidase A2 domain-containing protein n=1 Tax=Spodoptera exigua TaxID=7107 RepID=A0A922MZI2_SPOEX|nr:hypothetical protein HF086_005710 [Spodoptera exigua]
MGKPQSKEVVIAQNAAGGVNAADVAQLHQNQSVTNFILGAMLVILTIGVCQNIKKEHESLLISFVLKTRISRHAKLRLASNYDTSADLIKDMKNNLLTKQSATALQLELLQSRQGSQSIEEFGKKLEDLFVELTISQADGKEDAYKMFRPVNEKLAIQRFTEGLRNGRLSTILTARDYSELKDVIRAAKDEERAHQGHSTSAETVFAAQHRELSIFDSKYRMLVDTGASLSVVKYETIRDWNIPLQPECITINGIGGKSTTDGYVYIPFSICGKEFKHKFYVLKNLPCIQDGIIGQEFLKQVIILRWLIFLKTIGLITQEL